MLLIYERTLDCFILFTFAFEKFSDENVVEILRKEKCRRADMTRYDTKQHVTAEQNQNTRRQTSKFRIHIEICFNCSLGTVSFLKCQTIFGLNREFSENQQGPL